MNPITQLLSKLTKGVLRTDYEQLIPPSIENPSEKGIPRKIHQTYKSRQLPELMAPNIAHIQQINADWSYHFYDNEEIEAYILRHYGQSILDYYLRIDPSYGASRADFFRVLVLYQEGGIYLDLKTTTTQPLSQVLRPDDEFLLSYWDNGTGGPYHGAPVPITNPMAAWGSITFIQWCIISRARHPFLRAVILEILRNIDSYSPYELGVGESGTVRLAGPVAFSVAIYRELDKYPDSFRWVDFLGEIGIRYSFLEEEGNLESKQRHTQLLGSHYRTRTIPVVRSKRPLVQWLNVSYLKLMARYRRYLDGKKAG